MLATIRDGELCEELVLAQISIGLTKASDFSETTAAPAQFELLLHRRARISIRASIFLRRRMEIRPRDRRLAIVELGASDLGIGIDERLLVNTTHTL